MEKLKLLKRAQLISRITSGAVKPPYIDFVC